MSKEKILDDIEKVVADVAKQAASNGTSIQDKMDALKLLQPFYIELRKSKGRSEPDSSEGEPTMGDLQSRLRLVEQEPTDERIQTPTRRPGN